MSIRTLVGNSLVILPTLPSESFDCIVTSPPYWGLRDYGVAGQIGLEPTLDAYIETMAAVGSELWRVLKPSGTFWLNLGDSYARDPAKGGSGPNGKHDFIPGYSAACQAMTNRKVLLGLKPKDLCMVPARVALRLQADGWWLRSEIVWHKVNPMPESVTDRPTSAHEKVWLLTKSERYWYDADAIREVDGGKPSGNGLVRDERLTYEERENPNQWMPGGGRNARNVWTIASQPYSGAHFAIMPPALAERCIKAGCPAGGQVLDPFGGSGTTGLVADRLGRNATLIELNPAYREMQVDRIVGDAPLFVDLE